MRPYQIISLLLVTSALAFAVGLKVGESRAPAGLQAAQTDDAGALREGGDALQNRRYPGENGRHISPASERPENGAQ